MLEEMPSIDIRTHNVSYHAAPDCLPACSAKPLSAQAVLGGAMIIAVRPSFLYVLNLGQLQGSVR